MNVLRVHSIAISVNIAPLLVTLILIMDLEGELETKNNNNLFNLIIYVVNVFSPFLEFYPSRGSFQCNPPYCEELIDATLQHIDRLLSESNYPLSFIVFLSEYKDRPLKCMSRIEDSAYKRKLLVVPAMEHEYRHGYQHVLQKYKIIFKLI